MKTLLYIQMKPPVSRSARTGRRRVFTDQREREDRFEIEYSMEKLKRELIDKGLEVAPKEGEGCIAFYFFGFKFPESFSKTKRKKAIENGHCCKPDLSNLAYFLDNRLEKIFIHNDSHLGTSVQDKRYALEDFLLVGLHDYSLNWIGFYLECRSIYLQMCDGSLKINGKTAILI